MEVQLLCAGYAAHSGWYSTSVHVPEETAGTTDGRSYTTQVDAHAVEPLLPRRFSVLLGVVAAMSVSLHFVLDHLVVTYVKMQGLALKSQHVTYPYSTLSVCLSS